MFYLIEGGIPSTALCSPLAGVKRTLQPLTSFQSKEIKEFLDISPQKKPRYFRLCLFLINQMELSVMMELLCICTVLPELLNSLLTSLSLPTFGFNLFSPSLCPYCILGVERQEYQSGLPFPPPGVISNPGIKSGSPALQADSLPAELPGKPKHQLHPQTCWYVMT